MPIKHCLKAALLALSVAGIGITWAARDGSGNYLLPTGNPVTTGSTISSTWANTTLSDIGSALTQSISKDGQTVATANLPMGGFKHTNVAAATSGNQYATAGQVQNSSMQVLSAVAGTNTITGGLNPAITSYTTGSVFSFVPVSTNTGATTLAINGLAARALVKGGGGSALIAGDLVVNVPAFIVTSATQFVLLNPQSATLINGVLMSDLARLSQANTFTNNQNIAGAAPAYLVTETDAAADNRVWQFQTNFEQLLIGPVNDALGASSNAITVDRTGTTVDSINLQATTVQVNGVNVRDASILNAGTLADARVAQSSVTQHQAALAINADQVVTSVSTEVGSFTVAASHQEDVVSVTGASTVTVNDSSASALAAGDSVAVLRNTAGAVTFAAAGVQVILSPGSRLTIPEQSGVAVITYLGANTWVLSGV